MTAPARAAGGIQRTPTACPGDIEAMIAFQLRRAPMDRTSVLVVPGSDRHDTSGPSDDCILFQLATRPGWTAPRPCEGVGPHSHATLQPSTRHEWTPAARTRRQRHALQPSLAERLQLQPSARTAPCYASHRRTRRDAASTFGTARMDRTVPFTIERGDPEPASTFGAARMDRAEMPPHPMETSTDASTFGAARMDRARPASSRSPSSSGSGFNLRRGPARPGWTAPPSAAARGACGPHASTFGAARMDRTSGELLGVGSDSAASTFGAARMDRTTHVKNRLLTPDARSTTGRCQQALVDFQGTARRAVAAWVVSGDRLQTGAFALSTDRSLLPQPSILRRPGSGTLRIASASVRPTRAESTHCSCDRVKHHTLHMAPVSHPSRNLLSLSVLLHFAKDLRDRSVERLRDRVTNR